MKRIVSVFLIIILALTVCLTLTSCDKPKVNVSSVLEITDAFKGTRTITVTYPLSTDIDAIKDSILKGDPTGDIYGAKFTYIGATGDGYSFELKLSFNSKAAYEEQISALIGHSADVVLSRKNTLFLTGTRMAENFDVKETIGWIIRTTANHSKTKDMTFRYPTNKVVIGSDTFNTASQISINKCEGIPISAIDVKTYNAKDNNNTFDRMFIFSIPVDTYSKSKTQIRDYFTSIVGADQISDPIEGNSVLFTVSFEDVTLAQLERCTAEILDSDSVSIDYGDRENRSTPLAEGMVFEETLDSLSFNGSDNKPPRIRYTYSLPTDTTHGDGAVFRDGVWKNSGSWQDGAYKLEDASGFVHLRISDGKQYYIEGINFYTESLGSERFRRTTAFLYSKQDGEAGARFAADYFKAKGVTVKSTSDSSHIICSVISEGTVSEITADLVKLFGSGNFITYQKDEGALSLTVKTTFNEHLNLAGILNRENAAVPMYYYFSSGGGDNIVSLTANEAEQTYLGRDKTRLTIKGGVATVGYHGVIPKTGSVILYLIFGFALLTITIFAAYRMIYPRVRMKNSSFARFAAEKLPALVGRNDAGDDPTPSFAPAQTTTFSIFELNALSRNKKYVEEINHDIENRLSADRLEERKKEIRKKELEEMERKVYGDDEDYVNVPAVKADSDDEGYVSVPAVETDEEDFVNVPSIEPDDDADDGFVNVPPVTDDIKEDAPAVQEETSPVDPMELLDQMDEEDEDA